MQMSIDLDFKSVEKALAGIEEEIPRVLQKTINESLLDVQKAEVAHAQSVFKVTRPQFIKQSVKITKFAKKDELEGTIQIASMPGKDSSDILNKFSEQGNGVKMAKGNNVTIPAGDLKRSKSGGIPASQRPRAQTKAFKFTDDEGDTYLAKHTGTKKERKLQLLYLLRPQVRIRKMFPFEDIGMNTIQKTAQGHLDAAITHALTKHGLS